MKSNLQHKLLLALSKSKKDKGFTLIELLVVIIIIGVLSAVALPNLLGQIGKARETEAKNAMGAINRSQQAYHFEKQTFTDDLDNATLSDPGNKLGVVVESEYYSFSTTQDDSNNSTVAAGPSDANNDGVRSYAGAISFDAGAYDTAVCQSDDVGGSATGAASSGDASCSDGTELK